VSTGNSLPHTGKGPLAVRPEPADLRQLRSSVRYVVDGTTVHHPSHYHVSTHTRVHAPSFREPLAQHATWSAPRLRIAPFTLDMSRAMESSLHARKDPMASFVSVDHAVLDWCRLGLLTGSRVAEHAQTQLRAGIRFHTIPAIRAVGIWVGQALASLRSDLVFLMTLTRSYLLPS
jgi:hypothetical protein